MEINNENEFSIKIIQLYKYFDAHKITELILANFSSSLLIETLGKKLQNLSENFKFLRIENTKGESSKKFSSDNKTKLVQ